MNQRLRMTGVLLLLACCAGCTSDSMRFLAYLFAPGSQRRTQKAEFGDLPGHSVAIVIYANENVAYEYPYAKSDLARRIAAELDNRVGKVKVVDPAAVLKYQDENIQWDSLPKTGLGRTFGADYVLFVSLIEYTSREPNSVGLCRGRIIAEASVYQTSLPEERAQVWNAEAISVVFPKDAPIGRLSSQARRVMSETERQFVEAMVKKFYKHKVEVES